jgi:hypothetical protein
MQANTIHFPPDIWGELKYLTIPYPEIYFISGTQVQGYAVPEDYAGRVISKKSMACGIAQGGMLYFPVSETLNIIEYELLCNRLRETQDEPNQLALKNEIAEYEKYGRVDLTEYFGQYPPPMRPRLILRRTSSRLEMGSILQKAEANGSLAYVSRLPTVS